MANYNPTLRKAGMAWEEMEYEDKIRAMQQSGVDTEEGRYQRNEDGSIKKERGKALPGLGLGGGAVYTAPAKKLESADWAYAEGSELMQNWGNENDSWRQLEDDRNQKIQSAEADKAEDAYRADATSNQTAQLDEFERLRDVHANAATDEDRSKAELDILNFNKNYRDQEDAYLDDRIGSWQSETAYDNKKRESMANQGIDEETFFRRESDLEQYKADNLDNLDATTMVKIQSGELVYSPEGELYDPNIPEGPTIPDPEYRPEPPSSVTDPPETAPPETPPETPPVPAPDPSPPTTPPGQPQTPEQYFRNNFNLANLFSTPAMTGMDMRFAGDQIMNNLSTTTNNAVADRQSRLDNRRAGGSLLTNMLMGGSFGGGFGGGWGGGYSGGGSNNQSTPVPTQEGSGQVNQTNNNNNNNSSDDQYTSSLIEPPAPEYAAAVEPSPNRSPANSWNSNSYSNFGSYGSGRPPRDFNAYMQQYGSNSLPQQSRTSFDIANQGIMNASLTNPVNTNALQQNIDNAQQEMLDYSSNNYNNMFGNFNPGVFVPPTPRDEFIQPNFSNITN